MVTFSRSAVDNLPVPDENECGDVIWTLQFRLLDDLRVYDPAPSTKRHLEGPGDGHPLDPDVRGLDRATFSGVGLPEQACTCSRH